MSDAESLDAYQVLLAALRRIANDTSAAIVRQRVETPTSLLDLHTTVVDVQIRARAALG